MKLLSLFLSACVSIKPTPAVDAPAGNVQFKGLSRTSRMKLKWTHVGLVFFILVSLVMTGCFFWQYQLPKLLPGKCEANSQAQPHLLLSLQRKHLNMGWRSVTCTKSEKAEWDFRKCCTSSHKWNIWVEHVSTLIWRLMRRPHSGPDAFHPGHKGIFFWSPSTDDAFNGNNGTP